MSNTSEKNSIKESVLAKIKGGDIKKLPRSYFILRGILFSLAITTISTFLLFIASFIFFTMHTSGLSHLPQFGIKGIELLFGNLPWLLIFFALLLIICLEIITHRFSFIYRNPLLYSAFGIIFIVIAGSLIVRQISLHEKIYNEIENVGPRAVRSFYDKYLDPNPELFHPGTVVDIYPSGFTFEDNKKNIISVKISDNTRINPKFDIYKGGRLLVIGRIINGAIEADIIDNAPLSGQP